MKKIYEHADQQHVGMMIVYGNTNDHKLYANPEHTEYLDPEEAFEATIKGSLTVAEKTGQDDSWVFTRVTSYSYETGKKDPKDCFYYTNSTSWTIAVPPVEEGDSGGSPK